MNRIEMKVYGTTPTNSVYLCNLNHTHSGVAVDQDGGDGKVADQSDVSKEEEEEVEFSLPKLKQLDEQLGRPKWVVPVRARDELEMLIRGAITLTRQGKATPTMENDDHLHVSVNDDHLHVSVNDDHLHVMSLGS